MNLSLLISICCFVLLIDEAVGGEKGRKNGRKCRKMANSHKDDRSLKGILGYNRTFILYSGPDFPPSGLTRGEQFQKHNGYFGRDRDGIVEYAMKVQEYVKERYDITFPFGSEDELINGKTIFSQGRILAVNTFADPLGEFQLVFEANDRNAVTYPNPPPCSVVGYSYLFLRDYKVNGCQKGIQGVIPAGSTLKWVDIICNTTEYCGLEDQISFTLIPERPVLNDFINSKIVSEKYGEGVIVYPHHMTSGEAYGDIPFGIGVARFPPV